MVMNPMETVSITKAIGDWLASQGIVVLMLVFALKFGYDKFTSAANKHATDIKEAWNAKEKANEERFFDMKERYVASERRHEECEARHAELNTKVFQIALMTGNTKALEDPVYKITKPNDSV